MVDYIVFYGLHKREYPVTKTTAQLLQFQYLTDFNSILFCDVVCHPTSSNEYHKRSRRIKKLLTTERPKLVIDLHSRDSYILRPKSIGLIIAPGEIINSFRELKDENITKNYLSLEPRDYPEESMNVIGRYCYELEIPYACVEVDNAVKMADILAQFLRSDYKCLQ